MEALRRTCNILTAERQENAVSGAEKDIRTPLEVAVPIAERFLKIDPPRSTYMYYGGVCGLPGLWALTKDQRYLDFYMERVTPLLDKDYPQYDPRMYHATGDRKWLTGIEGIIDKRLALAKLDSEGAVLDPSGRYTIDTYSGHLSENIFLAHITGDHALLDEAMLHYEVNKGYLADPVTGMWYSRFGHHMHPKRNSPGLWSRGNGWLISSWGSAMHLWDPKHHGYEQMLSDWQHLCKAVSNCQTKSGLLRQLLDREDCFEEASGSALIFSGIANAVLHGSLPPEYGSIAYKGFCGMRGIVDQDGNIHNGSTTAGGYNFERQYYTCARFNEPHADGPTISLCCVMHKLLEQNKVPDLTPPEEKPVIVTKATPGVVSYQPKKLNSPEELAIPVIKRLTALDRAPEKDIHASTLLGLAHWYRVCKNETLLACVEKMLESSSDNFASAVVWNVKTELALCHDGQTSPTGLKDYLDGELKTMKRDRDGILVDEANGYSVGTLYVWIPLLAKAARLTGDKDYLDEAIKQLFGHQAWLEEPITGLWYATFGHGKHLRNINPGLWGLGNGYVVAAVTDLLDVLPKEHDRWDDVMYLMRNHIRVLTEYLPVNEGWTQLVDKLDSFPCPAANGLITYGICKAMVKGWIGNEYHAAGGGGAAALAELLDTDGNYEKASLPTAGLDSLDAHEEHAVHNDACALGAVLSGLSYAVPFNENIKSPLDSNELGVR